MSDPMNWSYKPVTFADYKPMQPLMWRDDQGEVCSLDETIANRRQQHGSFSTGAQIVTDVCKVLLPAGHTQSPEHEQAIRMIVAKLSRIVNGDPNVADHWHDIAGYAKCGEESCK